ncbi:MAG: glycine/sarcosine/betaine reductase complex component C subunit alpha [Defluviitaleaceae bacterium]|nr:glycine/sarcosine/betaine reductase complex component C subunit alpha [Defluviitaleaceae bacterium]
MAEYVKKIIADTFNDIAGCLETGSFAKSVKIGLMGIGSEHGECNMLEGAVLASKKGIETYYIGTLKKEGVHTLHAENEESAVNVMEEKLADKTLDGAVAMHYPFPIGISTVGRVITPSAGKTMFIATTTGTSATDRVAGMVKNAIYGIIAAKACGNPHPTVGILNVDGARQAERVLKELAASGYPINFASSSRDDGGIVMRGNDVLTAPCDIMVCDPLTGNILIKMLSCYTSGGNYETVGFGYGPGIGEDFDKLILIVSRASGTPVVASAMEYAAELVRGEWQKKAQTEFAAAKKAGLNDILSKMQKKATSPADNKQEEALPIPPKEVVTAEIVGIEIMDLDDAVAELFKAGIYAESGMGCTGPIVLVSEAKLNVAKGILKKSGHVSE